MLMRKALFVFCLAMAAAFTVACRKDVVAQKIEDDGIHTTVGDALVFDDKALPELTVSFSAEQWNSLLQAYDQDSQTKQYVHCDVDFLKDGRHYTTQDAGFRIKGQTSRVRPEGSTGQLHMAGNTNWRHFHIGLNFRHFHIGEKGYDIEGVHRINLRFAHGDPSYMREHYSFDLLRKLGVWTTLQTSWCRLYIHVAGDEAPVYYGVYLMTEAIDDEYLEARPGFGSPKGNLWKGGWGGDLNGNEDWRFGLDENTTKTYQYEYKGEAEDFEAAKNQIKDFIHNLMKLEGQAFDVWICSHCDINLLLKMYAVFIALGHWDDYWNNTNNFYLYFNSKNKENYTVYMLPYDLDNTLGTSNNAGVQTDSGKHDPYNWGMERCIFISKILSRPQFRAIYTKYLKELSLDDSPFCYQSSKERILEWKDLISPWLINDTGEDQAIHDRPAGWSNHLEYRIMEDGSTNWFRVKQSVLKQYTTLPE